VVGPTLEHFRLTSATCAFQARAVHLDAGIGQCVIDGLLGWDRDSDPGPLADHVEAAGSVAYGGCLLRAGVRSALRTQTPLAGRRTDNPANEFAPQNSSRTAEPPSRSRERSTASTPTGSSCGDTQ
jgi:hypothetical protein